MSRILEVRPRARIDIEIAAEFMSTFGRDVESRWRMSIFRAFVKIRDVPFQFPVAYEAEDMGMELRECLVGRRRGIVHRILFTADNDTVTVHRVRNAAQDYLTEDEI